MFFRNHENILKYFAMSEDIQNKYYVYSTKKDIELRGGSLISCGTIHERTNKPLIILCSNGHQFKAFNIIQLESWCPQCSKHRDRPKKSWNRGCLNKQRASIKEDIKKQQRATRKLAFRWTTETKVRELLEQKLLLSLFKYRIYYDKYNKHKFYEFDGYNEEHKIAFEYHGYQHYVYPNRFHKTEEIFKAACQRDLQKIQYCIENGIKLITIPYTITNLEQYIDML